MRTVTVQAETPTGEKVDIELPYPGEGRGLHVEVDPDESEAQNSQDSPDQQPDEVEPEPVQQPKRSRNRNRRRQAQQAAAFVQQRPDVLAGRLIILGSGAVLLIVMVANVVPYTRAVNGLLAKSLGLSIPSIGKAIGVLGLVAVQSGEVFPLTLGRPNREQYLNASAIATAAYAIDAALAIAFWPPLRVGLSEFMAAPLMTKINWLNILIIIITLFGAECFVKLCRAVNRGTRG